LVGTGGGVANNGCVEIVCRNRSVGYNGMEEVEELDIDEVSDARRLLIARADGTTRVNGNGGGDILLVNDNSFGDAPEIGLFLTTLLDEDESVDTSGIEVDV
jgi:hypothetical protein